MRKFNISVNGVAYDVEVEEIKDGASTSGSKIKASSISAPKSAPKPKQESKPKSVAAPAGATTVEAPMPGNVWKIETKEGQEVKSGEVLLILEAMKMENEIMAPNDGVVASIHVSEGDSVNGGDVLVSLK